MRPQHHRPSPDPSTAAASIVRGSLAARTVESAETEIDRWLRSARMPAGWRAEDVGSHSSGEGFVTAEEAAEVMYGSAHPALVERVTRLAQAHVLASRWNGYSWLIRPALVGVTGKLSDELMP